MNSARWRAALIGALVAAFATLPGLGAGTLWDNSETAYGEVAREILLTHDWIVLHLNGAAWFVQPPLYFWLAAAFAKVLGVSTFALRLPAALATIAMAVAVGYAVAGVTSARTALLATVILSTSLMQAVVGRLAIMDALLDLAVGCAVLLWFLALEKGGRRAWYGGWIALAFGTLAKGLVAPVAAGLVIVPWMLWERLAGGTLAPVPPARRVFGPLLFALLLVPWAAALAAAAGSGAFGELVGHYTVGRYLGTIENQSGPIWYYLPVVVLGFFPWFAFLAPAVAWGWRLASSPGPGAAAPAEDGAASSDRSLARLALAWAIVPLVFFSFAKTKLPNYIALEFPALAILVALWFEHAVRRADRRAALAWTAVVPVTLGGLAFALWAFSHDNRLTGDLQTIRSEFVALGGVVLAGSVACFALLCVRRAARFAPFALAVSSVLPMFVIAVFGEPLVERFKPIPALAARINDVRRPGDLVAIQGVSGGNALLFYTRPRVASLTGPGEISLDPQTDPKRAICAAPRALVVTSRRRPAPDPTYGRLRRVLASSNNDILFLYDGPPCAGDSSVRISTLKE